VRVWEEVVLWTLGLALVGAFYTGVAIVLREPLRAWRRGERKQSLQVGVAIGVAILVLVAASRVFP